MKIKGVNLETRNPITLAGNLPKLMIPVLFVTIRRAPTIMAVLGMPLRCRLFVVGTRFCASVARPDAGNVLLERWFLPVQPTAFQCDPAKKSTLESLGMRGFSFTKRSRKVKLPSLDPADVDIVVTGALIVGFALIARLDLLPLFEMLPSQLCAIT
jgi:hypothetical protein